MFYFIISPVHIVKRKALKEVDDLIRSYLIDDLWFYASEWKVPDLHFDTWDPEDDHFLHEFDTVEETKSCCDSNITIDDFLVVIAGARNKYLV